MCPEPVTGRGESSAGSLQENTEMHISNVCVRACAGHLPHRCLQQPQLQPEVRCSRENDRRGNRVGDGHVLCVIRSKVAPKRTAWRRTTQPRVTEDTCDSLHLDSGPDKLRTETAVRAVTDAKVFTGRANSRATLLRRYCFPHNVQTKRSTAQKTRP